MDEIWSLSNHLSQQVLKMILLCHNSTSRCLVGNTGSVLKAQVGKQSLFGLLILNFSALLLRAYHLTSCAMQGSCKFKWNLQNKLTLACFIRMNEVPPKTLPLSSLILRWPQTEGEWKEEGPATHPLMSEWTRSQLREHSKTSEQRGEKGGWHVFSFNWSRSVKL